MTPNGRKESALKSKNQDDKSENEKLEATSIVTEKGIENNSQKDGVQRKNISQIIFSAIQAIASIATVIMAILAWQTLVEMQTDRNNAYRPDLVVMPNSFEGGILKMDELELGQEYIVFDYNKSEPKEIYVPARGGLSEPKYSETCVCYENPYLTLKNIGKGTAKNVEVTFSIDWFEDAVARINKPLLAERVYNVDVTQEDDEIRIGFSYSDKGNTNVEDLLVWPETVSKENITYIGSDDDSVNVSLPEIYGKIVALLNYELITVFNSISEISGMSDSIKLPDLVISIQYSDMQGKAYNQEIKIPWSFDFVCEKDMESSDGKLEKMDVKMFFYKEYSR